LLLRSQASGSNGKTSRLITASTTAAISTTTTLSTTSTSTPTATPTTLFSWPCHVHCQVPAIERFAIQRRDHRLSFLLGAHGNKPKPFGFSGLPVHHDTH